MTKMIECKCVVCGEKFVARVADRKRGWAKCCSKSCAATLSNKKTGKYRKHLASQRAKQPKDMDAFFDKVWDDIYDACYRCDEK